MVTVLATFLAGVAFGIALSWPRSLLRLRAREAKAASHEEDLGRRELELAEFKAQLEQEADHAKDLVADLSRLMHAWSDGDVPTLAELLLRRVGRADEILRRQEETDVARIHEVEAALETETTMKVRKRLFEDKHRILASKALVTSERDRIARLKARIATVASNLQDISLRDEVLRATEYALAAHLRFRGSTAGRNLDREREHRVKEQRLIEDKLWELRKRPRFPGEDAIALEPDTEGID